MIGITNRSTSFLSYKSFKSVLRPTKFKSEIAGQAVDNYSKRLEGYTDISAINTIKPQHGHILQVYPDVITPDEETMLISFLTPILARKHYEGTHWDAVINHYKEIDLAPYLRPIVHNDDSGKDSKPHRSTGQLTRSEKIQTVKDLLLRVTTLISKELNDSNIPFLSPHVIDLAADGDIGEFDKFIEYSLRLLPIF